MTNFNEFFMVTKMISLVSLLYVCCFMRNGYAVSSFDLNLHDANVVVCLEPPLNVEKLDKCVNSSTNNIKKWSYLPDTGECAFLSAAEECAIENGNEFKNEKECRETCFYAKCFTSPIVTECNEDEKEIDFWYYNPLNGTCVKYRDGECPGNANGFEHEMDCYAECSKAICALGADRTECQGRSPTGVLQRWFMNITSGRCEQFSFSNCLNSDSGYRGGNSNNYVTEKDCVDMCRCKDEELPGMRCHPSLLNLKNPSQGGKTNSTSTTILKSKQENSTKLPQNLFTVGISRVTTETSTSFIAISKNNEITEDPHHGHNHNEIHKHEHENHQTTTPNKGTTVKSSLYPVFVIDIFICTYLLLDSITT